METPPVQVPAPELSQARRLGLLEQLKGGIEISDIQPTAWACLWLSDIGHLEELVQLAEKMPHFVRLILDGMEKSSLISQCSKSSKSLSGSFANTH
jgi:hypothetical protein